MSVLTRFKSALQGTLVAGLLSAVPLLGQPTIGLSPTSLSFTAVQGGSNPANQAVGISNTGAGTLSWAAAITSGSGLLSLNGTTSGTNSGTITVAVNFSGLPAGEYTGNIQVTAVGASNTPQNIPVTLTVTSPPAPIIGLSQTSLLFTVFTGDVGVINPANQAIGIYNAGGGILSWSATITSGANFMSLSGTTSGANNGTITVVVSVGSLTVGTYHGNIQVTAAGASNTPQNIPVTLTVSLTWTQQQELTASDGAANDHFGGSVSVSGDTAVIGAAGRSVGSNTNQGAAYVFVLSGGVWTQQQELTASDGAANDEFGWSVSVSGDTAVIGAAQKRTAYIFVRSGGRWTQQQELTASDGAANDEFGYSVSVSGNTAVIGAAEHTIGSNTYQGAAYVFVSNGGVWTQQQELTASDGAAYDQFGVSVSVSGDTALIGASGYMGDTMGAAYVFVLSGGAWIQQQELTPLDRVVGDNFGNSVSVSGDTAVIGATSYVGGPEGTASVFVRSGGMWSAAAVLTRSGYFGYSVSVSGDSAVIGDYGIPGTNLQGAAYAFVSSGGVWSQQQELTASDGAAFDFFGNSVSVSGDTAVIGAAQHTVGSNTYQGAAYMFQEYALVGPDPCGLMQNGIINVADVQLIINEALGVAKAVNDLNGDGVVNVVDVQIEINFALGLGCTPSGTTPANLSVSVKPRTYRRIAGTAPGFSNNSQTVSVALSVTAPLPTIAAVVNAANFQSGPVSPGEIVSIGGTGLGPSTPAGPAASGGVQVLFNGTPAPLTYVSATQINCIVPYKVPAKGISYVQVSYQGHASNAFPLTSIAATPALFTANGSGSGPAAALNQDGSYNSPTNPAAKGSTVVLFVTGEGQTSPPGVTGKVTTVSATPPLTPQPVLPVRVLIGGQLASVAFYGEAPGLVSGAMQLNVQIPSDLPSGNAPILVSIGGRSSQNGVTVSVQ